MGSIKYGATQPAAKTRTRDKDHSNNTFGSYNVVEVTYSFHIHSFIHSFYNHHHHHVYDIRYVFICALCCVECDTDTQHTLTLISHPLSSVFFHVSNILR